MVATELDTFVLKFHQLWKAGHTAHLDLDTCAGKAWVGLRVQLGHVPGPPHHDLHPSFEKKKDSPSRQRRRARRAAARQNKVTEEASNIVTVEETENREHAGNPIEENNEQTEELNKTSIEQKAENADNLNDEFCSNKDYLIENASSIETLVEEIFVKPENDWKDEEVENLIEYNLKIVGINVIKIHKEMSKSSESFRVKIQPTELKNLKSESFPIRNWNWMPQR
jgi:hypothetical protein